MKKTIEKATTVTAISIVVGTLCSLSIASCNAAHSIAPQMVVINSRIPSQKEFVCQASSLSFFRSSPSEVLLKIVSMSNRFGSLIDYRNGSFWSN